MDDELDLLDPDYFCDTDVHNITFDQEAEKYLLAHMLANQKMSQLASLILPKSAFANRYHAAIWKIVREYQIEHGCLPRRRLVETIIEKNTAGKTDALMYAATVATLYDYIDFAFEDEGWVKDEIVALAKHRAFRKFFDACSSDYHKHDEEFEQYKIELERIKSASVNVADLEWFDEETFFDSDDQQEYLLGDWIAQGCLHLFAAEKKIGKSTCTFSMVKPLISGEAWYGKIPCQQTNVIYLDYENPKSYMQGNLNGLPIGEQRRLFIPKKLPTYLTVEWLRQFVDHATVTGFTVLFIDSAFAAFGGQFTNTNSAWENNASQVRSVLDPLLQFCRETEIACVLIHHNNKSGDTTGSAQWEGGVDYVWSYERAGENRRLVAKHGRWIANKPDSLIFAYDNGLIMTGTNREVYQAEVAKSQTDLIDLIPAIELGQSPTEENCITQSGLAEVLDWSSGKISKELTGLVAEGRIFVAQEAVNKPKLYYRLTSIEA
ncbi:MAG: AAA family ATPase [Thermoguttaceae bacterium]